MAKSLSPPKAPKVSERLWVLPEYLRAPREPPGASNTYERLEGLRTSLSSSVRQQGASERVSERGGVRGADGRKSVVLWRWFVMPISRLNVNTE